MPSLSRSVPNKAAKLRKMDNAMVIDDTVEVIQRETRPEDFEVASPVPIAPDTNALQRSDLESAPLEPQVTLIDLPLNQHGSNVGQFTISSNRVTPNVPAALAIQLAQPMALANDGNSNHHQVIGQEVARLEAPAAPIVVAQALEIANQNVNPDVVAIPLNPDALHVNDIPVPDIETAKIPTVLNFLETFMGSKRTPEEKNAILARLLKENIAKENRTTTLHSEYIAIAPKDHKKTTMETTTIVESMRATLIANQMQATLPDSWKAAQRPPLVSLGEASIINVKISAACQESIERIISETAGIIALEFKTNAICVGDRSRRNNRLFLEIHDAKVAKTIRERNFLSEVTRHKFLVTNARFGDTRELSRSLGISLEAINTEEPDFQNLLQTLRSEANLGNLELSLCRHGINTVLSVVMLEPRIYINVTREEDRLTFKNLFPGNRISIPVGAKFLIFRYTFQSSKSELKLVLPLAPADVTEDQWRNQLDRIHSTRNARIELIPVTTRNGKDRTAGYLFCNDVLEYKSFLGLNIRIPWTDKLGQIREFITIGRDKRKRNN